MTGAGEAPNITMNPTVTSVRSARRAHACVETPPVPDPYTSQRKETAMTRPPGDPASDERELTQLVKDLNEAVVKADVAVLERVLHEDYVHNRPSGVVEDRAQYLDNRQARRVDFESLVPDDINVRV